MESHSVAWALSVHSMTEQLKSILGMSFTLSVCCVKPLFYVGQVDLLHSGSPLQTCFPLQLSVVAFPDGSWGKGGTVCPWSVYVWEWWAGASSPPPPLLLDPGNQSLEHPHYIYDSAPPTSRLYSVRMWANAHSSSRGFSSCSYMCALVLYLKSFLYSLCSSNAVCVWVTQCCAFQPLQDELDANVANLARYVVRNWPFMCWNRWSGKYSSNEGSQLGVTHSDTSCYVTGIDPQKSTSWARCQSSRSADLFAWAR